MTSFVCWEKITSSQWVSKTCTFCDSAPPLPPPPPRYLKFQNYSSTCRILSQSETCLEKFTETWANKFRKVWWGCLLLQTCSWGAVETILHSHCYIPPVLLPLAATSRLDHRTGNVVGSNWHIHRFPLRRRRRRIGFEGEGEKEEKWKVSMIKKALHSRKR
jgi:hypothetical protein